MNALADILRSLVERAGSLWPFHLIDPWEQGVKLLFGRVQMLCTGENGIRGTGLHWSVPLLGRIIATECNVEVFETEPQTVRSPAHGQEITFTLGIQARIERLDLYFTQVNDDLKAAVGNVARTAAADIVPTHLGTGLPEAIQTETQKRLRGWGVQVKRIGFITFTAAPCLRLITGRSSTNENPLDFVGVA